MRNKLRKAVADVTLVAGTVAVTWQDPDTVGDPPGGGTGPVTIELDQKPWFVWCTLLTAGGLIGIPNITAVSVTGCTLTSIWPGGAPTDTMVGDTSTYRVYAVCRAEDF